MSTEGWKAANREGENVPVVHNNTVDSPSEPSEAAVNDDKQEIENSRDGCSEQDGTKGDEEEDHDDNYDPTALGMDIFHNSMCMYCHGTGTTKVLMHKIPYFRELVISSFQCDDCYHSNNEVSFGGEIQLLACRFELFVTRSEDCDRQIIKSDSASIRIPEIELEIPPGTQRGGISTIQGFLKTAARNLGQLQAERFAVQPEVAARVAEIILALTAMAEGQRVNYTLIVEDIAGNAFIENSFAPSPDPNLKSTHFRYLFRFPADSCTLRTPSPSILSLSVFCYLHHSCHDGALFSPGILNPIVSILLLSISY